VWGNWSSSGRTGFEAVALCTAVGCEAMAILGNSLVNNGTNNTDVKALVFPAAMQRF